MSRIPGLREAVLATVLMALVSAFADAFWAAAVPEHRAAYGIVHGGLVLSVLGASIVWATGGRRRGLGAAAGLLIGLLSAVLFYVLFTLIGVPAMLVAWSLLWLAFGWVGNALSGDPEPGSRTLTRAVVAAALSGIGFWAISGIWLGPHDPGAFYWRNIVAWAVAFFPGITPLAIGRRRD